VLVRKRDNILKIIDIFQQKGIPYATDGKEDISGEKRVRQMLDILYLANMRDAAEPGEKDAFFYRVISGDYFKIPTQDILKVINIVKQKRKAERKETTLLCEFLDMFPAQKKALFKDVEQLNFAASAIRQLLGKSQDTPVHEILMHYIKDTGLYGFILEEFKSNNVLRIRELRALSSFVNMVKEYDLIRPGIKLSEFIDEIEMRKEHDMPLRGELVTQTQEGVRILTAHASKGLEFSVVFIPFCLQDKEWPASALADWIPLPPEIFKTKHKVKDKARLKELQLFDETRLFYVASSRSKAQLIYTASPTESNVTSLYIERIGLAIKDNETKEPETIKSALLTTDKKDPFIGTEAILKDLIAELSLNPTSLNSYINCKRKFLYNSVLQIPSTKKRQLVFGSCVHKALEEVYRHFKQTKKFPDFAFFRDSFMKELKFQGVDKSIYTQCEREVEKLIGWYRNESKNPVEPWGLEQRLVINIGTIVFKGYYDKTEIEDQKKKTIRVLDYKTGKPDKHLRDIKNCKDLSSDECDGYLRQLVAYKLLFDRSVKINKGYKVESGKLIFIDSLETKDFKTYQTKIADETVKGLEGVIKACWKKINNLEFEKLSEPDDKKCGTRKRQMCDYYDICWGR